VAFDSRNLRILVADTLNHRIQLFDLKGNYLFSLGDARQGNGPFNRPFGISADQAGNIYVCDTWNHCIQIFDEKGRFLRKFHKLGKGPGRLLFPYSVGVLSNGKVIVSDESRKLSIFSAEGNFLQFIGSHNVGNPRSVFVDSGDTILVVDNGVNSLFAFSKEGKTMSRLGLGLLREAFGVVANGRGEVFVSGVGRDDQDHLFLF